MTEIVRHDTEVVMFKPEPAIVQHIGARIVGGPDLSIPNHAYTRPSGVVVTYRPAETQAPNPRDSDPAEAIVA